MPKSDDSARRSQIGEAFLNVRGRHDFCPSVSPSSDQVDRTLAVTDAGKDLYDAENRTNHLPPAT
jgi:hypothetical protein